MFGQHKVPMKVREGDLSLSVTKMRNGYLYSRAYCEDALEKRIFAKPAHILLAPVEPVNLPRRMAEFLLIDFQEHVILEHDANTRLYVKFPMEIGVFVGSKGKYSNIDIVSLARQKLTMYGEGADGAICKYYKSKVYTSPPRTDPLREGVMEIKIRNQSPSWVELTRAVLNAHGMKPYYGEGMVSLRAKMKIVNEKVAETDFIDKPLKPGMQRSIELFTENKFQMHPSRFVMEAGI